jgi:hypothetical protein
VIVAIAIAELIPALDFKTLYGITSSPTPKLTRPPASLAINFERCKLLSLAQENARARGSALNALLALSL